MQKKIMLSMRQLQGYIAAIGVSAPVVLEDLLSSIIPMAFLLCMHTLNDFYPKLEEYVRSQQSKNESWAIELTFSPTSVSGC
jgi:hypothetical protein